MVNREDVALILQGWGLTDEPWEYDDGIHSWRCGHPDRYGRCYCFANAVDDIMELLGDQRD